MKYLTLSNLLSSCLLIFFFFKAKIGSLTSNTLHLITAIGCQAARMFQHAEFARSKISFDEFAISKACLKDLALSRNEKVS